MIPKHIPWFDRIEVGYSADKLKERIPTQKVVLPLDTKKEPNSDKPFYHVAQAIARKRFGLKEGEKYVDDKNPKFQASCVSNSMAILRVGFELKQHALQAEIDRCDANLNLVSRELEALKTINPEAPDFGELKLINASLAEAFEACSRII